MVGAQDVSSEGIQNGRRSASAFIAPGARALVDLPLRPPFSFSVHADLLVPIVGAKILIDRTAVWTTPPISGAIGAALVAELP
jgi:hypothetical protein